MLMSHRKAIEARPILCNPCSTSDYGYRVRVRVEMRVRVKLTTTKYPQLSTSMRG